jgi:hypothetical protein
MGQQALFPPFSLNTARASNAVPLVLHAYHNGESLEPNRLLPTYLRASEAEINRQLKL